MLAFQRSLPSPLEGFVVFDSMLVSAEIDRQSLRNLRDLRRGFLPRLSPDGSRLAYFQRATPARVIVMTLETGENRRSPNRVPWPLTSLRFPSPGGINRWSGVLRATRWYFVERDEGLHAHPSIPYVSDGRNGIDDPRGDAGSNQRCARVV
jgi:hypothetical protein